MLYGHKWTSAYGTKDDGTWFAVLAGITPEQIGAGLKHCVSAGEEWPPSAPMFRQMCLGKYRKDESGGDPHYCPTFNGPTHERITDRSRLLSSDDRDAQRAKNREQIAKMKQELRGGA